MSEDTSFQTWIETVQSEQRRADAQVLDSLFRKASGFAPRIWAGGIVGYGAYDYTYSSGRSGTFMATGFALRKPKLSIYIMPGYSDFGHILDRLGPHSKGKSCLYITNLNRVDMSVLSELIVAGLEDLRAQWPVRAAD